MTIPKSYEALSADLASEKIISKTLLGQKEAYMMLADKGRLDLSESKAREAALREELEALRESYEAMRDRKNSIVDLQQRLIVAEQRTVVLTEALEGMIEYFPEGHSDGECFSVQRANFALGRPNDCFHDWFPDHCLKCGIAKP